MNLINRICSEGILGCWLSAALILAVCFTSTNDAFADSIPHAGAKANKHYSGKYANARRHKAFVIAPMGGWQWVDKQSSAERAIEVAVEKCQRKNSVCVPYDVDGDMVFDSTKWASVFAPYPDSSNANSAPVGSNRGELLPDLAFMTKDGEKKYISDFRGKVLFVNLWASWCPACQVEMPSLNALYKKFKINPEIQFLTIGTRESVNQSFEHAERKKYSLPIFHTGISGKKNKNLPLRDGEDHSEKFVPTSFVVDRNGVVIFKKVGDFSFWEDFEPQLRHIIENSG